MNIQKQIFTFMNIKKIFTLFINDSKGRLTLANIQIMFIWIYEPEPGTGERQDSVALQQLRHRYSNFRLKLWIWTQAWLPLQKDLARPGLSRPDLLWGCCRWESGSVHCQGTVTPDLCASPCRPARLSAVMETVFTEGAVEITAATWNHWHQHVAYRQSSCEDCDYHFLGRRGGLPVPPGRAVMALLPANWQQATKKKKSMCESSVMKQKFIT